MSNRDTMQTQFPGTNQAPATQEIPAFSLAVVLTALAAICSLGLFILLH